MSQADAYRRTILSDIERSSAFLANAKAIVDLCNSQPDKAVMHIEGLGAQLGRHQPECKVTVRVAHFIAGKSPTIAPEIRRSFLELSAKIDEICPVYGVPICFTRTEPATSDLLHDHTPVAEYTVNLQPTSTCTVGDAIAAERER